MVRPKIDENERINTTGKTFYYPYKIVEYDLIWKEFESLSNELCSGITPSMYKAHIVRRANFMLRRLVFEFVYNKTKKDTVKEVITNIMKKEANKNIKAYKTAMKNPQVIKVKNNIDI